ncbi:MFS transporter [Streptacidiphilus sp. PAMC 29251]
MSTVVEDIPSGAGKGGEAPGRGSNLRWLTLAVIAIAQLMVVLDSTIVNIALPSAQQDLGFSTDSRQWVVTAYSLTFGGMLLLGGRVADLIGRKTALLIGLAGFAGASALAGAAWNFEVLIAGRALQGAAGALLAPTALSLLTTTFTDPRDRAKAFGIFGSVAGVGGGVGLLLGGLLTEHLNWRYCLYVNLVFAAVAFAGSMVLVPRERANRSVRIDVPGAAAVTAGLFAIVYGFANAESHSWSSVSIWGFLLVGVALLAVFVWIQTRSPHPLLPLRILLDRNRGAACIAVFVAGAGIFGVNLFFTYYLQNTLGYSPVKTGLAILPMVAAIMTTSNLSSGVLVPRFGPRPVVPAGMALAAGGLAWLTTLDADSGYTAHMLPPLVVFGLGIGLVLAPGMSLATLGIAPADAGVGSANVNTMQQIGGSVGTAVLSSLAAGAAADYLVGRPHTRAVEIQSALDSYSTAYTWAAVFFAVGCVACALLFRSGPITQKSDTPVG